MAEKGTFYNFVTGMVDGLLQISVYRKNNLDYDFFIDVENEDWIEKVYEDDTFTISNAMIEYHISLWYERDCAFSNQKLLKTLFNSKSTGIDLIYDIEHWQKAIKTKKNDARLNKIFSRWDDELALFPEQILPAFEKMMAKEGSGKYFMFFENKESKTGYCSHCRKDVPLMKAPKQNATWKCPCCRKKVVFKRQNQIQTLETNSYDGAYAQKVGDSILIRKFWGTQSYRGRDFKNPYVRLEESVRYILYPDATVSRFWFGMYNPRFCRWNKNTNKEESWARVYSHYDYSTVRNIYKGNLSTFHTSYNLWKKKPCDMMRYMIIEHQTHGIVEKLVKVGLYKIAFDFMTKNHSGFFNSVNLEGKDFGQVLKLDKAKLKRLEQFDDTNYYKWLLEEKIKNTVYDDSLIKAFIQMDLTPHCYNLSSMPPQLSYSQIYNYVKKQSEICFEDFKQTLTTWRDYLAIAQKNKWDMDSSMIYKPTNLKEMHAKALLFRDGSQIEKETAEIEQKWPKVNANLKKMKRFTYGNDKFTIVVPDCVKDIVKEGHCLQHCIHDVPFYFDRITSRETYIFFLRKTKDLETAWYTIEVEQNGNILQKRTTGDNQNKDLDIAIPFLKEFQKFFINQMTEEDKKLGIVAENNRKQRYKDLREQNAKIWHGKLAGQLLADVLENDLIFA